MIVLNRVTKRFDAKHGIFDVSFKVEPGMIFGFVGPNGSGKSTTIRHLMGLMKADEGSLSIGGHDCWRETSKVKQLVGYLPGEITFPSELSGAEVLQLVRNMHGAPSGNEKQLLERFPFDTSLKVRKMSKGMKQKLAIVTCFMKDAPVYLLDEPTSGLDPLMQEAFLNLVLEEKKRGKAILMSSHHFPEMEKTCDRAALIKDGRIVIEADIHELIATSQKRYLIECASVEDAQSLATQWKGIQDHQSVEIAVTTEQQLNALIHDLGQRHIKSLHSSSDDLEQVFLHYYGEENES